MKRIIMMITVAVLTLVFTGCGGPSEDDGFRTVDAEEAKAMMESEDDYVILDVRTEDEYRLAHIEGAVLLPDYEVEERAEEVLPRKDQLILIYCRSGNRSRKSAETLASMGYTDIVDFGGLGSWPYETVK